MGPQIRQFREDNCIRLDQRIHGGGLAHFDASLHIGFGASRQREAGCQSVRILVDQDGKHGRTGHFQDMTDLPAEIPVLACDGSFCLEDGVELGELERRYVRWLLERESGEIAKVATVLGVSVRTVYRKLGKTL